MRTLSFIAKRVTRPANISTLHPFSTPTPVNYPLKIHHYHFGTRPTLSHPQEKIYLPSIRRNRLRTGRGWRTRRQPLHSPISPLPCPFPLDSEYPCRILSACGLGVYMYDQPGMEIGLWSNSYRCSGYTHHFKVLSTGCYNKL
jgi:hypothetical protein